MWKKGFFSQNRTLLIRIALWRLQRQGWMNRRYELTRDGLQKAASIVRVHRLWELYLTEELGYQAEKVHRTAEEMEHIIKAQFGHGLWELMQMQNSKPTQKKDQKK